MNIPLYKPSFLFYTDYVDPGTGYDPTPGYEQGGSHGYGQGGSNGFCGFLGKLLMCQCSEDAGVICEEGRIPYGFCPMHPMMPTMRTQCCPRTYVMMCSQQNNPYETQQGSYFLMMQSAANPEL